MATGNSQPGANRKGIDFKVRIQIPWNAPKTNVTLDSFGVFELDTFFLPDVLGLCTWHPTPQQSGCCWIETRGVFGY